MEQNFQTSFIPKKPVVEDRAVSARPVSGLLVIAIIILFGAFAIWGGIYFYRSVVSKQIVEMKKDLALAESRFEPAKIADLQVLDKRMRAASAVLANHKTITPIFEALEKVTMKTVRFTKFAYVEGDGMGPIKVLMSGQAVGYRSIALQADLMAENKIFQNPVFSNLTLDQSGNVLFDLAFTVDPATLNYKRGLEN